MVKINFNDPEQFRQLERQAYDGQLDFNDFPAAEHRYFDRVQNAGYRVRHEGYPKDFARQDISMAKRDYLNDLDTLQDNLRAQKQYTEARIRMGQLVNEIYKEHSPLGKRRLALEFVELTIGEDGLASRNLSENYLEAQE